MQRVLLALSLAAVAACSDGGPRLSPEAERGRAVYAANCLACHAADPNLDGALGPSVAGAARLLIEARVLRAEYPPGYTPKRDTRVMVALPHLADDIDALHSYLREAKRQPD
jgi:mono/diheme cytochrome c family protein